MKSQLFTVLFLAALLLTGLSSCGGDSGDPNTTKTYNAHGVTFDYPGNWKTHKLNSSNENSPNALWGTEGIVLSGDDVIVISGFRLKTSITQAVFDQHEQDLIDEMVQTTARDFELSTDPEIGTVDDLPAIMLTGTGKSSNGKDVTSLLTFAFKDNVEYFINCQATEKKQTDVEAACQQVLETFAVTGPPKK